MRLVILCLVLSAAACGPGLYRWDTNGSTTQANPANDKTYTVQRGDTLYSIAWRYGLDYRELARMNSIGSNYLIHPGQILQLHSEAKSSPAKRPEPGSNGAQVTAAQTAAPVNAAASTASGSVSWRWPADGAIVARFGASNATGKGIDLTGRVGDPVRAAADGTVVYAGSGLIGYGRIIIVKHSEEFLSAYGHNDELFVREGEQVKRGEKIAALGRGPGNKPLLHFEIRVNGKAVDPMRYLPSR